MRSARARPWPTPSPRPAPNIVEVRKPRDIRGPQPHLRVMDMDDDASYRALATRDARFDGRLFVGVKTTGIYCRPICPARTPKRENVRFYPTAAAAQSAGFRPCLRCRPETSPDLAAWRGASNTAVARALSLIEGWRARRQRRRRPRGSAGGGRAATSPPIPQAPRRLADQRRPDPARALGQAADPRDPAADGRGGAGLRLRQRAPLQRDVPAALRPATGQRLRRSRRRRPERRPGRGGHC